MDVREEILSAATELFHEKGLHFTMDDVAVQLHRAKKTIYRFYPSKEDLLSGLLTYGFEQIQHTKEEILKSDLPLEEKLAKVLVAFPDVYQKLDFSKLNELGEKYPKIAQDLRRHLEDGWEPIIALMEEGVAQGKIRPVNLKVFRLIATADLEYFVSSNELERAGVKYHEALDSMVDIFMKGLMVHDAESNAQ
ncbi:TetR/AcrR family transcriptional regulator [Galactobacillus timonensis]|uniref:TetR/AcrR family transcriptional regulator n=1 Tax=Galactobacillus timonensis TaxID=2041840 RepID=UPI000C81C2CC|nr:TetR/AcrR family transcriptional regulator [Galactobacillus timonensis]